MISYAYRNHDARYTIHQEENHPVITLYFPYGVDWKSNAQAIADELYWRLEEATRPTFIIVDMVENSLSPSELPLATDYVSQAKWLHHKNLHKVMIVSLDKRIKETVIALNQQTWAERISCA